MPRPKPPVPQLRAWQQAALEQFAAAGRPGWLTTATPGAGKTTYALTAAATLWHNGHIDRLIVVAPTDHLRRQWIDAARDRGFDLRPTPNDERLPADAEGCVVTYAQVALAPHLHAARTTAKRTMVIFDEVHHAGDDKSWGAGVINAFSGAVCQFCVTGTPFRSDDAKIAFVTYEPTADGGLQSVADFTYGYTQALADKVVRPVTFAAYAGNSTWTDSAGAAQTAMLGDPSLTRDIEELAWKTALDPDGEWIPHVFAAAWAKVRRLRATTIPDAGVLIPAANQQRAREYADVWQHVTGNRPTLVLSDDPTAAANIAKFRDNPDEIALVCVRMVTEGVDIPRLACLTWTTTASTPLFFAQMIGRVVRARNPRERATVFLPAVSRLLALAAEIETERDHVLRPDSDEELESGQEAPAGNTADLLPSDDEPGWKPVSATAAFRSATGTQRPPDEEGLDDLFGMEGLLTPEQEAALLAREESLRATEARRAAAARRRQREQEQTEAARVIIDAQWGGGQVPDYLRRKEPSTPVPAVPDDAADLRRRITKAVGAYAAARHITHGEAWGVLYGKTPGPKNAAASLDLLRRRYDTIHAMLD